MRLMWRCSYHCKGFTSPEERRRTNSVQIAILTEWYLNELCSIKQLLGRCCEHRSPKAAFRREHVETFKNVVIQTRPRRPARPPRPALQGQALNPSIPFLRGRWSISLPSSHLRPPPTDTNSHINLVQDGPNSQESLSPFLQIKPCTIHSRTRWLPRLGGLMVEYSRKPLFRFLQTN